MAEEKKIHTLNVGSQTISLATFVNLPGVDKNESGGVMLERVAQRELLADPSQESSYLPQLKVAVSELISEFGIVNKVVHYCVSAQAVFSRFVKLPPLTQEKVDQIVEFEARQNVPFPINEVIWDYQLLGKEGESEIEVALAAIKAKQLNDLNEVIEASGAKAGLVDVAPYALVNAFRYNYSDVEGCSLLVDIGARCANYVFIENDKIYTRSSSLCSGSLITQQIAKEFETSFGEAEQNKVNDGFIALGGAYADHPDPRVANMSKVIRNVVTRLHGDVSRTITFYKGQHSGSRPNQVYLSGGCAGLGYIKEFFEDKIKLPTDFLNPLRNVAAAADLDQDFVSANAHKFGELVGLSLREKFRCPMEVNLEPDVVQKRREVASKKPFLISTLAALIALFVGLGIYFKRGENEYRENKLVLAREISSINEVKEKLDKIESQIKTIDKRSGKYTAVGNLRRFWLELLSDLNKRVPLPTVGDKDVFIWLTEFVPYAGERALIADLSADLNAPTEFVSEEVGGARREEVKAVTHLGLSGLYLANTSGQSVIYEDFYNNLKESPYFNIKEKDITEVVKYVDSGADGSRWAYTYSMILPLSVPVPFD